MLFRGEGSGTRVQLRLTHSNQCLNISGGSRSDGGRLIQYPCSGGTNELWRVALPTSHEEELEEEDYSSPSTEIVSEAHSSKCLDVRAGSFEKGLQLIQWTCHDGLNQKFSIEALGADYRIRSRRNGLCIGVQNASREPGAPIVQEDCVDQPQQRFELVAVGSDVTLRPRHSGQCVNISGGSLRNGGRIIQWPCQGGTNELWSIRPASLSLWEGPYNMPLVPVAAANLPDGRILTWSAWDKFSFGGDFGETYTAIFDPQTKQSTERLVSRTGHDMFCPGTALLADGSLLVNGGSSSQNTSIYDPQSDTWEAGGSMNIGRGYQANTVLADGSVLTIGGSWSGGTTGNRIGEVYDPESGWQLLTGLRPEQLETEDDGGRYRADNHMWLFTASNGLVFHAGPSRKMHWIDPVGNGTIQFETLRGTDSDAMNGNAVLFDVDQILTVGGAPNYSESRATSRAHVIDLSRGVGEVQVREVSPMRHARVFHNSVVLPSGEVVVVGGQVESKIFSDSGAVLEAEIWNPETEKFRSLSSMEVPRTYHSQALLLQDGRVLVGGGGLCGDCTTNHPDVEILTPPYLLDSDGSRAVRPKVLSAPTEAARGDVLSVELDPTSGPYEFALIRTSAATHSVNNDQRRVPLSSHAVDGERFSLTLPEEPGTLIPGNYFLFVLDGKGVPSVGHTITIF